jgi:hypothetical protein
VLKVQPSGLLVMSKLVCKVISEKIKVMLLSIVEMLDSIQEMLAKIVVSAGERLAKIEVGIGEMMAKIVVSAGERLAKIEVMLGKVWGFCNTLAKV